MKIIAVFFFSSLFFGGLGKAQTVCSTELAVPLSFSHGTCDNFGSSSGGTIEAPITLEGLKIATQGSEGANNLITREVTEPVGLMEMRRGALKFRQRLNRRSEFSCSTDENCYVIGPALFCAKQNGDFHDPDGTTGNINTGHYTLIDGQQGNVYCSVQPTLSATAAVQAAPTTQAGSTSAEDNPNAPQVTSGTNPNSQTGSSSSSSSSRTATSAAASLQSFSITLFAAAVAVAVIGVSGMIDGRVYI